MACQDCEERQQLLERLLDALDAQREAVAQIRAREARPVLPVSPPAEPTPAAPFEPVESWHLPQNRVVASNGQELDIEVEWYLGNNKRKYPRPKGYLSVFEASRDLGVAYETVRRWVQEGKLSPVFIGARVFISRESAQRVIEDQRRALVTGGVVR